MSWNWKQWPWSKKDEQPLTAMQQRVKKIPTVDLNQWASQTLGAVSVTLSRWERAHDTAWLNDAINGTDVLGEVLREISRR